ncbi:polyprotein [Phytophthora citrophthora]|uniref:Polyprotein n=1 Tax=Phytophthora citrophthora TaxID=4793 RepID=A0AAD9LBJ1_9STRA|nr:polyprotein [Phytophthora citrophthora]
MRICGGNLDSILQSLGGIRGGGADDAPIGDKALAIMDQMAHGGSEIHHALKGLLNTHADKKAALDRLLHAESYRRVFDNSKEAIRTNKATDAPDEELVAYTVPEVSNVWTGFLTNIFDRAKHIHTGIYTHDNMRNIVAEVNGIYRHYEGKAPDGQLTRHIMMQLVAEDNRRYGVVDFIWDQLATRTGSGIRI